MVSHCHLRYETFALYTINSTADSDVPRDHDIVPHVASHTNIIGLSEVR